MESSSADTAPLCSIPSELAIKIYALLPFLSDVFALAATCQRLRCVWLDNSTSIYKAVAPGSIPCERYARRFLVDQGGPPMDYPTLSARDVLRLLRNAAVVKRAIRQFETDIVSRLKRKYPAPS